MQAPNTGVGRRLCSEGREPELCEPEVLPPNRRRRSSAAGLFLLGAMWGGLDFLGLGNDPLEGIDVEAEYELVKAKKSNLSAAQRKAVVRRMEGR